MDENLKKKINIAKEAVKDHEEPYKTEAFKIILSSLIDGTKNKPVGKNRSKGKTTKRSPVNKKIELEQKTELDELAKKCKITRDELSEVISIKNNIVQIVKRPKIVETQKHVLISACILAAYRILYELEWVSTGLLKKCLDDSGVGDLGHYAEDIDKSAFFVSRGIRKGKEFKITGKGLDEAYEIIKKLSNDEDIVQKIENRKNNHG